MRDELRKLLALAWPTSLGMLAFMGMSVVDTVCVGRLGEDAQAGVAIATGWGLSGAVLAFGSVRAIEPIVAQSHGEGDKRSAGVALARMLALCLPLSILAAGWYLLTPYGLRALGQPESVIPDATTYAWWMAWSWPIAMVIQTVRTFLQALGIVRPAMVVTVMGTALKAPVNLAFIEGWGGLPAMGVAGAAVGTLVVDAAILAVMLWLVRGTLREYWPVAPDLGLRPLGRLLGLGLPLGVQMGTEFWAFAAMAMMMGWIGERAMAAHAIAINLASVSFMIPLGVATAASARVGHRFGAGEDWGASARAAIALGVCTQVFSGAVFWLLGAWLVRPYSPDPAVQALAASLLPIAAAFQLFDGMQVIGFGVLRGAGDVRVPTIANLVGYYVFGLPVGYFLGIRAGYGPTGIWWGISVGLAVVSLTLLARIRVVYRRGAVRVR